MDRSDILSSMKDGEWAISVHEHIGYERLVLGNGIENIFVQYIPALFESLCALNWYGHPKKIASVVMTMPRFRLHGSGYDFGYENDNEVLIAECLEWYRNHHDLLPLLFLSMDVHDEIADLEKQIRNAEYPVMGIKFHPRARNFSIQQLVESKLLHFIAQTGLPIMIHCHSKNHAGSFRDLCDNKIPELSVELGFKLCIAHAGFLDEDILEIAKWKNIFIDLCPWSMITENVFRAKDFRENVKKMVELIACLPDQVLYGGDTPFDRIRWTDGIVYGQGRAFDFRVVKKAISEINGHLAKKIFYVNPLNFLS